MAVEGGALAAASLHTAWAGVGGSAMLMHRTHVLFHSSDQVECVTCMDFIEVIEFKTNHGTE